MKASDVRPITYLKNSTAQVVKEVSEHGRPMVITQNGHAKVVVMDVGTYDRWQETLALLKLLAQADADVGAGRTIPHDEAMTSVRAAITRVTRRRHG